MVIIDSNEKEIYHYLAEYDEDIISVDEICINLNLIYKLNVGLILYNSY